MHVVEIKVTPNSYHEARDQERMVESIIRDVFSSMPKIVSRRLTSLDFPTKEDQVRVTFRRLERSQHTPDIWICIRLMWNEKQSKIEKVILQRFRDSIAEILRRYEHMDPNFILSVDIELIWVFGCGVSINHHAETVARW